MKILIAVVASLSVSGCLAMTDHSRTLNQYNIACDDGKVRVDIDSFLKKEGGEFSDTDSTTEAELSVTALP